MDAAREIAELKAAARRLQQRLAAAEAKTSELVAAVYEAASDAALVVGTPDPVPRPERDRRRGPEAAVLHMTDWQMGKRTESYDADTCAERVRLAARKACKLAAIQRADHPVRECHLLLGGDLVEGVTIFPGQAWEVSAGAFGQVFAAASLIEEIVLALLADFERVSVWEVSGNHGRIGRRGEHPREDNLDRIVCRIARDRLSRQQRLSWHEPNGWYARVEIGAYKALLVHGDQVKSFGGQVPAYGIVRKATAWATGVTEPFSDVWMGHFHAPMQFTLPAGGQVLVTGSPESGNEYAREFVAARGRPSQRLAFVDPRRGRITASYILWLDE
jgi:hypothetical protein